MPSELFCNAKINIHIKYYCVLIILLIGKNEVRQFEGYFIKPFFPVHC